MNKKFLYFLLLVILSCSKEKEEVNPESKKTSSEEKKAAMREYHIKHPVDTEIKLGKTTFYFKASGDFNDWENAVRICKEREQRLSTVNEFKEAYNDLIKAINEGKIPNWPELDYHNHRWTADEQDEKSAYMFGSTSSSSTSKTGKFNFVCGPQGELNLNRGK